MIQCCAQRRYIRRPDNNFGFELTSIQPHFNSVSKEKFEKYSSGAPYVIKLSFTQNYFGTSSGKYSQF